MERVAAVVSLAVFVLVILSATVGVSTAKVSPVPTDTTALQSPVSPPAQEHHDPYYVEHPRKVTPRAVPYVNEYGETIVREEIITHEHREAEIIRYKAVPAAQPGAQIPDTFNSPLETPYTYTTYLPVVMKNYLENAAVMAIVYQGKTPGFSPTQIVNSLTGWIRAGTAWHGYTTTGSSPAIGFYLTDNLIHFSYTYPPTQTNNHGYLDLNAIYNQFNICNRITAGEIDEVWILVDGTHFYSPQEYTVNDQGWSNYDSMPTPYCGRRMYTMLLNFDTIPANAFESWTHSAEFSWKFYQSGGYEICDVPMPPTAPPPECSGLPFSSLYAFESRPAAANNYVGMCGDAHWPPNKPVTSTKEYDWYDTASYPNRCTDWQWGNATSNGNISCSTWGCSQEGFFVWYLQNVPGINNDSHGRTGALRPNWWNFRMPQ